MNSQHIVDSIINRDYNEAEQTMFESLTKKLSDKIIESKYEVANQFREEMDGESGYDAFFKKAMKKFGISSPADLKTDEKKKEFFDYIDKNFTAKNEGYGGMGMMRKRGGSEEEFPFGQNPFRPVSTPDDRPPVDPRPVGGRPGPKITRDPLRPNFPGISDPVGGGRPGPKITQDPLRPNFPGIEGEMPEMGAEMMGMDKEKDKESDDLETAIKKALDVAGKEQAQAPQAQGGMPPMGGGGENPMAAMAKMMGGGQTPPMDGGGENPMAAMAKMMGGMKMNRRKMGGGM